MISYGRFPNGIGNFQTMNPTFNAENEGTVSTYSELIEEAGFEIFPNPADDAFYIDFTGDEQTERTVVVYSIDGKVVYSNTVSSKTLIDTGDWHSGMYLVRVDGVCLKLVVR